MKSINWPIIRKPETVKPGTYKIRTDIGEQRTWQVASEVYVRSNDIDYLIFDGENWFTKLRMNINQKPVEGKTYKTFWKPKCISVDRGLFMLLDDAIEHYSLPL
jgi:hypothetical protein